MLEPDLRLTPVICLGFEGALSSETASLRMKVIRPVASTRERKIRIPPSASAQPERVLMYPQSPLPPPVPTSAAMALLSFNSRTASLAPDAAAMEQIFSYDFRTYSSPCCPLSETSTRPDSE